MGLKQQESIEIGRMPVWGSGLVGPCPTDPCLSLPPSQLVSLAGGQGAREPGAPGSQGNRQGTSASLALSLEAQNRPIEQTKARRLGMLGWPADVTPLSVDSRSCCEDILAVIYTLLTWTR